MKEKRRARIGIVTNRMSERVYTHLQEKANNNELTHYIVSLVEQDLAKEDLWTFLLTLRDEYGHTLKQIKEQMEELSNEIRKLKKSIQSQERGFEPHERSEGSLVDDTIVPDEQVGESAIYESVFIDY